MTNPDETSLGSSWRRQGRWKWWVVGLAILVVIGLASSGSKNNSPSTTGTETAAQAPPQNIVPSMTSRNEAFWESLSSSQRTELAKACSSSSYETPAKIAEQITEQYAQEPESSSKIWETCANVVRSNLREHEEKTQAEVGKLEERKEERAKHVKESVENHTFVATDASIREYIKSDLIGEGAKEVTCRAQVQCTVSLDDYTPSKAGKIATFLGLARSAQEQLVEDPDKVFAAVFADPHMQEATVISWDELETNGGKNVRWPAISVVCDASAAKQIDWEKVSPAGIEELCKVTLLPDGPPQ